VVEVRFILLRDLAARADEVKLFKQLLHASVHVLRLTSRIAIVVGALPVGSLFYAVLAVQFVALGALLRKGLHYLIAETTDEFVDQVIEGAIKN